MLVSSCAALHLTLTNISLTTFLHISPPDPEDEQTTVAHIHFPFCVTFTKYSDSLFNMLYMKNVVSVITHPFMWGTIKHCSCEMTDNSSVTHYEPGLGSI